MYVSTKDMHEQEVKVRLTEDDKNLLVMIARRLGLKPAVLARSIIVQALTPADQKIISGLLQDGRP